MAVVVRCGRLVEEDGLGVLIVQLSDVTQNVLLGDDAKQAAVDTEITTVRSQPSDNNCQITTVRSQLSDHNYQITTIRSQLSDHKQWNTMDTEITTVRS